MFLLRSAFWLGLAFLVMAPPSTDFGAAATGLRDQVVSTTLDAGSEIISRQIMSNLTTINPSAVLPMQDSPAVPPVLPRARPAAMG